MASYITAKVTNRLLLFALKQCLGRFVQSIPDHNIDLQVTNGRLDLCNILLNAAAINELIAELPVKIRSAKVENINISIPWSNILSSGISLSISGINIVLEKSHPVESMSIAQSFLSDLSEQDPLLYSTELGMEPQLESFDLDGPTLQTALMDRLKEFFSSKLQVSISGLSIAYSNVQFDIKEASYTSHKFIIKGLEACITPTAPQPSLPSSRASSASEAPPRELMQSMLFSHAEAQGLMQSVYMSAIEDSLMPTRKIFDIEDKITVTFGDSVEIVVPDIEASIGTEDFAMLLNLFRELSFQKSPTSKEFKDSMISVKIGTTKVHVSPGRTQWLDSPYHLTVASATFTLSSTSSRMEYTLETERIALSTLHTSLVEISKLNLEILITTEHRDLKLSIGPVTLTPQPEDLYFLFSLPSVIPPQAYDDSNNDDDGDDTPPSKPVFRGSIGIPAVRILDSFSLEIVGLDIQLRDDITTIDYDSIEIPGILHISGSTKVYRHYDIDEVDYLRPTPTTMLQLQEESRESSAFDVKVDAKIDVALDREKIVQFAEFTRKWKDGLSEMRTTKEGSTPITISGCVDLSIQLILGDDEHITASVGQVDFFATSGIWKYDACHLVFSELEMCRNGHPLVEQLVPRISNHVLGQMRFQRRNVDILLRNIRMNYHPDKSFFDTLLTGVEFPDNSPSVTKTSSSDKLSVAPTELTIELENCGLSLTPLRIPAQAVVLVDFAKAKIVDITLDFNLEKASVFLINDVETLISSEECRFSRGPIEWAKRSGYVSMGYIKDMNSQIRMKKGNFDMEISAQLIKLESCADSMATLISLAGLLTQAADETKERYRVSLEKSVNIFEGLEESTFRPTETMVIPVPIDDGSQDGNLTDSYFGENGEFDKVLKPHPTALLATFEENVIPLEEDTTFGMTRSHMLDQNIVTEISVKDANFPVFIRVRKSNLIWDLHDGYDWKSTRDKITSAVDKIENRSAWMAENNKFKSSDSNSEELNFHEDGSEHEQTGELLFKSIMISIPKGQDRRRLREAINRGLCDESDSEEETVKSRKTQVMREKQLRLTRSSKRKIGIHAKGVSTDFMVLSSSSQHFQNSLHLTIQNVDVYDEIPTSTWNKFLTTMRSHAGSIDMLDFLVKVVKPVEGLSASELWMKADVAPLRFHVDQDALDFFARFFTFEGTESENQPVGEPPFIQYFEIASIPVKLDYKPRKVDYIGLKSGKTTEFMNFVILEESEMTMDRVVFRGVSGFERLGQQLNNFWMPIIQREQLPGVLGGISCVREVVRLGDGVKNLIMVPVKEYRKDGRVVRSIQKGFSTFAKSTAIEGARFGTKLAIGTKGVLENTEELLSSRSRSVTGDQRAISQYADQPKNVASGIQQGYKQFSKNLASARDAMKAVPKEIAKRGSAVGAAEVLLKAIPPILIRPVIGASEAVGKTLMGVSNQIDPTQRKRVSDVNISQNKLSKSAAGLA
ncbi:Autophagy-related protein 2 [Neolecta irregularis DAH-3]|uniref:Autophagy-related protein 2 n=1 Tax=Neolecta irregularis (strain DAH-3) TaxID=1198029 RepID=A0A1U7LPZ9_NEOID|nr:Autophagy-related protein 2 [Neolecta irregularis DAH-3]|eukprot:OLL24663.1 Autophagy-related protein 2 [Neolecta irregularis DAH-3]